ncbi:Dihydrodipicolinate reductase, bacterial/plant [Cynara cardunculus var. scolymus]|uniref:4-hydroxy-tetrahydrodipicolinate reductase n=1 Tax=Cynara cardunculus var. scolymus TaxID=59895 RepID=A0A118K3X7_CYNCS|nr:Dihydrodipicolinate reductase, bacterial/plant [Cynara cardunculus var. scolymus]
MAFVLEVPVNLLGRHQNLVSFSSSRRPSNFINFTRKQRCKLSMSSTIQSLDEKHLDPANDLALPIMVNSCTGKMGQAVIEAGISAGLHIVPASFGIQQDAGKTIQVGGKDIQVHGPSDRETTLSSLVEEYPNLIIVDFTVPNAVNDNAELYCKTGVPFVMGTTGGDRDLLYKTVEDSKVYAVISPQMGKQVVAFLAAMEIMAKQFPGAFSGYTLELRAAIDLGSRRGAAMEGGGEQLMEGGEERDEDKGNMVLESHQSTKLDTSGTAKAVISCFQKLGVSFDLDEVQLIRDPKQQIEMVGVPEEHLNGHAFHMYHLTSPDGTVSFEFQHNVCGRSIYAEGAIDAALFLAKKIQSKADKKIYDMIDVLREGSMR